MEVTPEIITQFGLMNKISTGNSFIDILMCLLVPMLLKYVLPWLNTHFPKFFHFKGSDTKVYRREIQHVTKRGSYRYYDEENPPNHYLQQAILLYLNMHMKVHKQLQSANVQLIKSKHKGHTEEGDTAAVLDDTASTSSSSGDHYEHQAAQYEVNFAPPLDEWIDLEDGIRFLREEHDLDDKGKTIKHVFRLECSAADGNKRIDAFLQAAYDHYRELKKLKKDNKRYMYMPQLSSAAAASSEEEKCSGPLYKRYQLSDEKTFANLFHPDKLSITQLVDNFLDKKGKFAIPGYPHKLGFLLHGPPGTGKTSFIKALAQYTGRSIISIPLERISTNQELMDMMFDQQIQVLGEDGKCQCPFSKVIYVMEDVDAASDVVQKRSSSSCSISSSSPTAAVPRMLHQPQQVAASKKKEQPADEASGSDDEAAADDQNSSSQQSPYTSSCYNTSTSPKLGPSLTKGIKSFKADDELNLAGLLNVLDGVVDTPGRIIIMTSNHPEKLDPALIRPGRINKRVYMGRIRVSEALQMVVHYFAGCGGVSAADMALLREVLVDDVLSPAELETLCADFDSVAELVDALKVHPRLCGC